MSLYISEHVVITGHESSCATRRRIEGLHKYRGYLCNWAGFRMVVCAFPLSWSGAILSLWDPSTWLLVTNLGTQTEPTRKQELLLCPAYRLLFFWSSFCNTQPRGRNQPRNDWVRNEKLLQPHQVFAWCVHTSTWTQSAATIDHHMLALRQRNSDLSGFFLGW